MGGAGGQEPEGELLWSHLKLIFPLISSFIPLVGLRWSCWAAGTLQLLGSVVGMRWHRVPVTGRGALGGPKDVATRRAEEEEADPYVWGIPNPKKSPPGILASSVRAQMQPRLSELAC